MGKQAPLPPAAAAPADVAAALPAATDVPSTAPAAAPADDAAVDPAAAPAPAVVSTGFVAKGSATTAAAPGTGLTSVCSLSDSNADSSTAAATF